MFNKIWNSFFGSRSDDEDEAERNLRWTRNTIMIGLAAGFGCNILFAVSTDVKVAMLATAILVSGAAFAVGTLIGFLFGIPRTDPHQQPANRRHPDAGAEADAGAGGESDAIPIRRYQVNTNLEQVSDWLTKILVGVGLTQVHQISTEISNITTWLTADLDPTPLMQAAIATSMIYFMVCGFLAGYVMTRLFLSDAFAYVDGQHKAGMDMMHMVQLLKLHLTGPDTPEKEILTRVICDRKANKKYLLPQEFLPNSEQHQALRWLQQQGLIWHEGRCKWEATTPVSLTAMAQKVLPLVMDVVPCDVAGTPHPGQDNGMNPPAAGPSTPTPSILAP